MALAQVDEIPPAPQLVLEPRTTLRTAGLFAGIGGIELGLAEAGHDTRLLCEIWDPAKAVLSTRFPDVPLVSDVRELDDLPDVDLVAAGFPCQDLSQAGRTRGIRGPQSSLVENVFRLLEGRDIQWVLLENVPFMLHLENGRAMRHLVDQLEVMGFRWAYRVIDARAFGLPQRRRRVVLLASREADPAEVLFADDASEPTPRADGSAYGFYWTEGSRGLGWAVDAVPTLKGGSGLGIPSSPAVWVPATGLVGTLDIRDAERLQGFAPDWTLAPADVSRRAAGLRWKLVGNAVNVRMARWLGTRLSQPERAGRAHREVRHQLRWPNAAFGGAGRVFEVDVSAWPLRADDTTLTEFLRFPLTPLSHRASTGFLSRARASNLKFMPGFLDAVQAHLSSAEGTRARGGQTSWLPSRDAPPEAAPSIPTSR